MRSAKHKIRACVKAYAGLYPQEFEMFKQGIEGMRKLAADKYASAKHAGAEDMRVLFEMPETLHNMIINTLSIDELDWFKRGGANHKEGGRWFAKEFPVFRVTADI